MKLAYILLLFLLPNSSIYGIAPLRKAPLSICLSNAIAPLTNLGEKRPISTKSWKYHYDKIKQTLSDENPSTVNRSEWKSKLSSEEAFQYINNQLEATTGSHLSPPRDRDYDKAIAKLYTEVQRKPGRLISRDPPPPPGATDKTFTYYSKTLVEPNGGKHQIRVRTYIRSIDPHKMHIDNPVEAFDKHGNKFIFTKQRDDTIFVTKNNSPLGKGLFSKNELLEELDGNLRLYAPHGKRFKLEVKSRDSDILDLDDYPHMSGPIFVQKLDIKLTEANVFDLFSSNKSLSEIKASVLTDPSNKPERVDAIFDLIAKGSELDENFRTLAGSTEYQRYAFGILTPDEVGGQKVILQTTMDYDMGVRFVYDQNGKLLSPSELIEGANPLIPPSDPSETFHVELKSPRLLSERVQTSPETVSEETKSAMRVFHETEPTQDGKFFYLGQRRKVRD